MPTYSNIKCWRVIKIEKFDNQSSLNTSCYLLLFLYVVMMKYPLDRCVVNYIATCHFDLLSTSDNDAKFPKTHNAILYAFSKLFHICYLYLKTKVK